MTRDRGPRSAGSLPIPALDLTREAREVEQLAYPGEARRRASSRAGRRPGVFSFSMAATYFVCMPRTEVLTVTARCASRLALRARPQTALFVGST